MDALDFAEYLADSMLGRLFAIDKMCKRMREAKLAEPVSIHHEMIQRFNTLDASLTAIGAKLGIK